MNIPSNLKYTQNDEWILVEGNIGTIGISDYAQSQLSDIVYIDILLSVGEEAKKGDTCATVESVKAAADVYIPVSGKIILINESLSNSPEMINNDPYGDAWMIKFELSDPTELESLMDSKTYEVKIQEKE